ncbi:alpha/beta fold hydrolase [Halobaculum gomorrense]|uniref:Pimeloyl-ACP methyl ester carboxylesterase n=1 Tax=Halobaculum gomorrense TaxID=43928 RepID=A0A1M5KIC8_9EURY|nr:alpha/beta hydrolase [Halobaculum gomorrense]SHG52527.1 Pimeloyl-ACP methyl ester carboxylesterase [Halobaculum gomorrense]
MVGLDADHEAWTAAQSETTVAVDGRELDVAYYEAGRDNDGPPVFFLHGIPTWSFLWRGVAPAVAEDRHVIAPDLVGYGNSQRSDNFDRSVRAQTSVLADLIAEAPAAEVDLVAHDIGGGVALRYAAARPQQVRTLALSNAACFDSWPVEYINSLGVPGVVEGWDDAAFEENMAFLFEEGAHGEADPAFVAGMKAPWEREGGRTALARAAVATNTNHTTCIDYGAITAETLCLWGADDVLQPIDNADRLADAVAGDATVIGLDDAYHWVTHDRTEAYREELRAFLTN